MYGLIVVVFTLVMKKWCKKTSLNHQELKIRYSLYIFVNILIKVIKMITVKEKLWKINQFISFKN